MRSIISRLVSYCSASADPVLNMPVWKGLLDTVDISILQNLHHIGGSLSKILPHSIEGEFLVFLAALNPGMYCCPDQWHHFRRWIPAPAMADIAVRQFIASKSPLQFLGPQGYTPSKFEVDLHTHTKKVPHVTVRCCRPNTAAILSLQYCWIFGQFFSLQCGDWISRNSQYITASISSTVVLVCLMYSNCELDTRMEYKTWFSKMAPIHPSEKKTPGLIPCSRSAPVLTLPWTHHDDMRAILYSV